MTVISMNIASVRTVATRLERRADVLIHGCQDLTVPSPGAATSAELGRAGAAWIGFLTEMRISLCATAQALQQVCSSFEETNALAELSPPDRRLS